jgi:hypothetical protein
MTEFEQDASQTLPGMDTVSLRLVGLLASRADLETDATEASLGQAQARGELDEAWQAWQTETIEPRKAIWGKTIALLSATPTDVHIPMRRGDFRDVWSEWEFTQLRSLHGQDVELRTTVHGSAVSSNLPTELRQAVRYVAHPNLNLPNETLETGLLGVLAEGRRRKRTIPREKLRYAIADAWPLHITHINAHVRARLLHEGNDKAETILNAYPNTYWFGNSERPYYFNPQNIDGLVAEYEERYGRPPADPHFILPPGEIMRFLRDEEEWGLDKDFANLSDITAIINDSTPVAAKQA